MRLMQGKMIKTAYPDLADEHTIHEKGIWDFKMTEIMKTEHVLEGNLWNLFAVRMSLCDPETKNQVKASAEYKSLEMALDSMGLLSVIKRLVNTGVTNNLHVWNNKSMAIMNLMTLYQKKSRIYRS